MSHFKHHKYFKKTKTAQAFRFPFVCFSCRKSFKYPESEAGRICPQCRSPLEKLGRKFSAPPSGNKEQWDKVEFLVKNGFRFYTVYEQIKPGVLMAVKYPATLQEARSFVEKHKPQTQPPLA
jgi:predicted amidophosphoribosyltransferase